VKGLSDRWSSQQAIVSVAIVAKVCTQSGTISRWAHPGWKLIHQTALWLWSVFSDAFSYLENMEEVFLVLCQEEDCTCSPCKWGDYHVSIADLFRSKDPLSEVRQIQNTSVPSCSQETEHPTISMWPYLNLKHYWLWFCPTNTSSQWLGTDVRAIPTTSTTVCDPCEEF